MSRKLIGWSEFALNGRRSEIVESISDFSSKSGIEVSAFTPQTISRGNRRDTISNPHIEHKRFFSDVLSGKRQVKTLVNYAMLLRRQLTIEFSKKNAFSSPSKTSIINDCGQYFYREVFTKLFTPIIRGYKVDEKITRNSVYSFYKYVSWLYSFINANFLKKERDSLLYTLKEALGGLHSFFMQTLNISTTSLLIIKRTDSLSQKRSSESRELRVQSTNLINDENSWREVLT